MNRPNPLHPDRMTVHERRSELHSLLALGLRRFCQVTATQQTDLYGESSLHNSDDLSGTAVPKYRITA